jgi:hypothetical protein
MTELGLRKNPTPIVQSAVDILAGGPDDFTNLCATAKGIFYFIIYYYNYNNTLFY